jgi:hypothetical protein
MITKLFKAIVFILCIFFSKVDGQEFRFNSGLHTFFDNREYFNDFIAPQTILGARAFVDAGFAIDPYSEFLIGANFMYECGSHVRKDLIHPTLYFHFNKKPFEVYTGAFRRNGLFELPFVLETDTFQYYRPNVEGIYLKAEKPWAGKIYGWIGPPGRQIL